MLKVYKELNDQWSYDLEKQTFSLWSTHAWGLPKHHIENYSFKELILVYAIIHLPIKKTLLFLLNNKMYFECLYS